MKESDSTSVIRSHGVRIEPYRPGSARPAQDRGELIVRAAFASFDVVALAVALGCVCAIVLWMATVILLVKGAPEGISVGPHLALLAHFLPGYNVSWTGSVLGLVYGFVIGVVLGTLIAATWNVIHHIYLVFAVTRRYFARDL
jgi:hypothetical protein